MWDEGKQTFQKVWTEEEMEKLEERRTFITIQEEADETAAEIIAKQNEINMGLPILSWVGRVWKKVRRK